MSAKKTQTNERDRRDEVLVYAGPTLHRRKLVSASCYRAGLPADVSGLAEKIPELAHMIVPLADLQETRRRVKEPGTEENRIYQHLLAVRFDADGEVRKKA